MGNVVQAVADFLIDERCRGCGRSPGAFDLGSRPGAASHPLLIPLSIGRGPIRVTTRLLCEWCAGRVRRWPEPVRLPRRPVRGARSSATSADGCSPVVYPAFFTDDVLLRLVHVMKFERRERVATWLARAIANQCPRRSLDDLPAPPVVVPVPMDRRSRRLRGFNQADRIARTLGRVWNVPVAPAALEKTRRTLAQSRLGRSERAHNLAHAIAPGIQPVTGMSVVVVDDLVTTGATVETCAAVLWQSGATSVRVVCVGYRP